MGLSLSKLGNLFHIHLPRHHQPAPKKPTPPAGPVDTFEPAPANGRAFPAQRPMPRRASGPIDAEQATRIAEALYGGVLGRHSDPDGLAAHASAIAAGRLADDVNGFVLSPEFQVASQDLTVEQLSKRLYQQLLGRDPDEGGDLGTRAEIARGNLANRVFDMLTSPEMQEALARPPAPVTPPAPTVQKRTGMVRAEGSGFRDDQGRFNALGATMMDAAWMYKNDRAKLEQTLETLSKNGFDYVRCLGAVGNPGGPDFWDGKEISPNDPDYKATIAGLTDLAYDKYGMRIEWTLIGDGQVSVPSERERYQLVDTFLDMSKGREEKIMHFELANEAWQNGFSGDQGREQLRKLTKYMNDRTDILVAASAPDGGQDAFEALYKDGVADLATIHFDRDTGKADGHWRPVRQPWEAQYLTGGPKLFTSNEPIGPGSSVNSENDPVKLVGAAIASYVSGVPGYVFHSKAGVRGDVNVWDMPGVDAFKHVKDVVPADISTWDRKNAHWADAPFKVYAKAPNGQLEADRMWPDNGGTGAVRAYGAVKGGEFFVFPMGIKESVTMEPRRNAEFDVIDPMTGEVVEHKRLNAGERFDLAGKEMFVLRGRYV